MNPLDKIFKSVWDKLSNANERTNRLAAYVDGDTKWMLTCRPKLEDKIECDNGNTYKKEL